MATRSSRARTLEIREFILATLPWHPKNITQQVAEKFQISRQAAHRHVNRLVTEGIIVATGETRDREYHLKPIAAGSFNLTLTPNLQEDVVWREKVRPYLDAVANNVLGICQFGFTEMLNNAIHHSGGTESLIGVEYYPKFIQLMVSDNGIGIFKKIQLEMGLNDEREAILELAKGKFTTDPAHHTGEGIFFTSRVFDYFAILSDALIFQHEEPADNWLVDSENEFKGSTVIMRIASGSKRQVQQVFDKYASAQDDYGFTRTNIPVKLARYGDENLVSRSQAKRLLNRFEKFKEVVLDFEGVDSIGQAFADEIFRVFANEHPKVHLSWIRANTQIKRMISRAVSNSESNSRSKS